MTRSRSTMTPHAMLNDEHEPLLLHHLHKITDDYEGRAASADGFLSDDYINHFATYMWRQSSLQRKDTTEIEEGIDAYTEYGEKELQDHMVGHHPTYQSTSEGMSNDIDPSEHYEKFHALSKQLAFKLTKLRLKYCHNCLSEIQAVEEAIKGCYAVKRHPTAWNRVIAELKGNKEIHDKEMRSVIMLIQRNKTFKKRTWGSHTKSVPNPTDIPDPYEPPEADAMEEAVEELCYNFADLLKRLAHPEPISRMLHINTSTPN